MASIWVTNRAGEKREVEAAAGRSVMELIRDSGMDELVAMCGGNCSCATCHVWVESEMEGLLPGASEDEKYLLEGSAHNRPVSRLACQIVFEQGLAGLHVVIAPEE